MIHTLLLNYKEQQSMTSTQLWHLVTLCEKNTFQYLSRCQICGMNMPMVKQLMEMRKSTFRHLCLPVFTWRRVVVHFFNPKQILRVSCILWCYFQNDFQPYFKTLVCGASFSNSSSYVCMKLLFCIILFERMWLNF